jgi:ABC-type phosphate/phosphonate transport system permease subunit
LRIGPICHALRPLSCAFARLACTVTYPARLSFVFALLLVAAAGLGPFAGVPGTALSITGSAAKLFADHRENAPLGAFEAVRATGASRTTAIAYALVPDILPAHFDRSTR